MLNKYMENLGVDCWGVLFHPSTGHSVEGAAESLRRVVESGKYANIYIISKVPFFVRPITRVNFHLKDFFNKSGIPEKNLYFCGRYSDKINICRKLGVTRFIDDRFEVLKDMKELKERYAFDPTPRERAHHPEVEDNVKVVTSWEDLLPMLLSEYIHPV
jgi:hypothetical protein